MNTTRGRHKGMGRMGCRFSVCFFGIFLCDLEPCNGECKKMPILCKEDDSLIGPVCPLLFQYILICTIFITSLTSWVV